MSESGKGGRREVTKFVCTVLVTACALIHVTVLLWSIKPIGSILDRIRLTDIKYEGRHNSGGDLIFGASDPQITLSKDGKHIRVDFRKWWISDNDNPKAKDQLSIVYELNRPGQSPSRIPGEMFYNDYPGVGGKEGGARSFSKEVAIPADGWVQVYLWCTRIESAKEEESERIVEEKAEAEREILRDRALKLPIGRIYEDGSKLMRESRETLNLPDSR